MKLPDGITVFDPFPEPALLAPDLVIRLFPDISSPARLTTESRLALKRTAEALNLCGSTVRAVLFFET